MITKTIFPGRYIQGLDALKRLREEIERLSDPAKNSKSRVIVGIGGGKTMDTAKAVAHSLEGPVIIVSRCWKSSTINNTVKRWPLVPSHLFF